MAEEEEEHLVGEGDDKVERSARPNSHFLSRVLTGMTRLNQRVVDTNASKAARKAVGASGAASLRPVLARAHMLSLKQGPAAIRRAALTAAQQQKLTLCASLLTEVALSFGFKLHVHGPDGVLLSPSGGLPSPGEMLSPRATQQHTTPAAAGAGCKGEEPGQEEHQDGEQAQVRHSQGEEHATAEPSHAGQGEKEQQILRPFSPQPLPLEDLSVTLTLATEEGISATAAGTASRPGQVSRGSALLKAARPRIALNTLEGLGSALRRAAHTPGSAGTTTITASKHRALLAKQGSGSSQGANEATEGVTGGEEEDAQEGRDTGASDEAAEKPENSKATGKAGAGASKGARAGKARIVWQPGADGEEEVVPVDTQAVLASTATATAAATAAVNSALRRASASTGGGDGLVPGMGASRAASTGRMGMSGRAGGTSRSSMEEGSQGEGVAGGAIAVTGVVVGTGSGAATPQAPGSGGKRPPSAGLNGLFSAALRDLKKVKQVVVDEGG